MSMFDNRQYQEGKYAMDIQDKMVKELFENKSIKALKYLIECGRELEFKYKNKGGFISRDNSNRFVSVWIDKNEQSFESIEELIEKAKIDNIIFKDAWKEIVLDVLY